MTPLTVLGALAVIGAWALVLQLAASFGGKRDRERRERLRLATPPHRTGRRVLADREIADEYGRPQ